MTHVYESDVDCAFRQRLELRPWSLDLLNALQIHLNPFAYAIRSIAGRGVSYLGFLID